MRLRAPVSQMCGQRDPGCPRPHYCENCLPRDRAHLSDLILVRCDGSWYGLRDNPPKALDALRVAVEWCTAHMIVNEDGVMVDQDFVLPSELLELMAGALSIPVVPRGA